MRTVFSVLACTSFSFSFSFFLDPLLCFRPVVSFRFCYLRRYILFAFCDCEHSRKVLVSRSGKRFFKLCVDCLCDRECLANFITKVARQLDIFLLVLERELRWKVSFDHVWSFLERVCVRAMGKGKETRQDKTSQPSEIASRASK